MATANPYYFPITQLPDHILLEIFLQVEWLEKHNTGHFPYEKNFLLPPIASVCSRWRELYFQPQLWRSKVVGVWELNKMRHQFQFFSLLNRMAGEIHSLEIDGSLPLYSINPTYIGGHRFLPLLPTFPSVENLIFGADSPARELDLLVDLFPAVQSVRFGLRASLNDAILLQMASGWSNLRKFDISSYVPAVRHVTAAGLIRFAQVANHIESLNINEFPDLTDSDFDEITMALGVGLKSITFGHNQKNLSGLAIESLVRNCPNVEQIFCLITASLSIGRLKDLSHLKCLQVQLDRNCQGFEDLFSRPFSQFRSFDVAMNVGSLTDSHLELLADTCPQLESLGLSVWDTSGIITDSGLSQIFNKCRNLRVLCLWGFPLLTGRSFIGAGAKLPNLSRLELHDCRNIDAEMVRRAFVRSTRLQIKSDLPGPWDLRRF